MFHFNLPALLPGGLLPLPSAPPPVSTSSVTFQTRFLSLFLVAVLPAIRQAVSLRCIPIPPLAPPLLGTIPSSVLDGNCFQTNDLYIFTLSLFIQFYCCYYLLFLCAFQLCQLLRLRQLPFPSIELFYFPLFQEYDWFLGLLGKLNQVLFS